MASQINAHLTAKFGHFLDQSYLDSLNLDLASNTAQIATPIATQAINNQSTAADSSSPVTATLPLPESQKTENVATRTFVPASITSVPVVQKNLSVKPYEKSQITPAFIQKQLCENPYHFYAYRKELLKNAPEVLGADKLHVCPCPRVKGTDRIRTEQATMALVQHFHPTDHPFTIVSVGAGNCYQELVHIAKLNAAGYKDIHLVVIDQERMPVEELRHFCDANLPPCHIKISAYASLEEYLSRASSAQSNLYQNNLKNREFGKEAPSNYCLERANIAARQGASGEPTPPKTDSSGCFGIKPNLLLLMDISHIKVEKTSFLTHAFEALQTRDLLRPNTVVAYSHEHARGTDLYIDIVGCGLYMGDKSVFKLQHPSNTMSQRIHQDSGSGLYQ